MRQSPIYAGGFPPPRREVDQVDAAALGDVLATVRAFVRERAVPAETEIAEKDRIPAPLRDAGKELGPFAVALTEAEAGSDPATITTAARRDGEDWVLTGSKRFITNAPVADLFFVFARTDPDAPSRRGISAFVVERDRAGLSVGPRDVTMGQ